MALEQYVAAKALSDLLKSDDPSLDKIMEYHAILMQNKKYHKPDKSQPYLLITLDRYITLRQEGHSHKDAWNMYCMSLSSIKSRLVEYYPKTQRRLQAKLVARLK
jgi:hypothetical protein